MKAAGLLVNLLFADLALLAALAVWDLRTRGTA
jgi:hypothetical protein